MKKQPLLILCVCFILGILLQEFFRMSYIFVLGLLIFSILTLIAIFIKNIFLVTVRAFILGLFFFSIGVFSHYLQNIPPKIPSLDKRENLIFRITKKLNSNEKNRRFEALVFKGRNPFNAVISMPKSITPPDFLHYYKADFFVNKPAAPEYIFLFDYQKYLARKKIFYQLYLPDQGLSSVRQDAGFQDLIKQKRLDILNKIDDSGLSKNSAEFLKGLILADRTEMDSSITQDFTRSGLVHFLAISGTHMVVIFWFLMLIFNRLFPLKFRTASIVLSLAFIWIFAIFIDYGSSVVRSCIMLSVYYGFILLQRKPDLLHAMAVAAFAILIFDTNQIFDVGFQLSFLAVFGIYWLNQPILNLLPTPRTAFFRFIFGVFSVTLAAQLITLPLILYYFHQFSLISIIANLFIVPLSEIIIVFSLLMTFMIGFVGKFSYLNSIYDFVVFWLLRVIHFFADVNAVFFERIPMTFWEAIVLMSVVLSLRYVLMKKNLRAAVNFGCLLLIFFALRLCLNFQSYRKEEVLLHHFNKNLAVSFKSGSKVCFWLKGGRDGDNFKKFIAEPCAEAVRAQHIEFFEIPEGAKSVTLHGKSYPLR